MVRYNKHFVHSVHQLIQLISDHDSGSDSEFAHRCPFLLHLFSGVFRKIKTKKTAFQTYSLKCCAALKYLSSFFPAATSPSQKKHIFPDPALQSSVKMPVYSIVVSFNEKGKHRLRRQTLSLLTSHPD
jgi:hypothetical protein